jgi:hypothetical protein
MCSLEQEVGAAVLRGKILSSKKEKGFTIPSWMTVQNVF